MNVKELGIQIILAKITGIYSNPNRKPEECTPESKIELVVESFQMADMILEYGSKPGSSS